MVQSHPVFLHFARVAGKFSFWGGSDGRSILAAASVLHLVNDDAIRAGRILLTLIANVSTLARWTILCYGQVRIGYP